MFRFTAAITGCYSKSIVVHPIWCISAILEIIKFFSKLFIYWSKQNKFNYINQLDRVKRIWYLSPMRAAKVQASLRIRAVSPEPSLLAHTSSKSRGTFRKKASSLAPLNGWACAVEICHDGMLEDTTFAWCGPINFHGKTVLTLQETNVWPSRWDGWSPRKLTCCHVWLPALQTNLKHCFFFLKLCLNYVITSNCVATSGYLHYKQI